MAVWVQQSRERLQVKRQRNLLPFQWKGALWYLFMVKLCTRAVKMLQKGREISIPSTCMMPVCLSGVKTTGSNPHRAFPLHCYTEDKNDCIYYIHCRLWIYYFWIMNMYLNWNCVHVLKKLHCVLYYLNNLVLTQCSCQWLIVFLQCSSHVQLHVTDFFLVLGLHFSAVVRLKGSNHVK